MPVLTDLRVVVGETRGGLKLGDWVTLMNNKTGRVARIETKNLYQHITLETGERGRLPIGHEVNVKREQLTFDEKLSLEQLAFARQATEHVRTTRALLDRLVEQLNARYWTGMEKNGLYPFDLDDAAQIAKVQCELALWREVEADAKHMSERGEYNCWLSAVMAQREVSRRALTENFSNPLSRSTSVISNITDDLKKQAHRDFLYTTDRMNAERLWEWSAAETMERREQLKEMGK